jgi:hypothetical protein
LRDLAAGKAVDYEGKEIKGDRAKEELKKLATRGMSAEERAAFDKKFKTEVSDEKVAERRAAKLNEMSDEEVAKLYKATLHEKGLDTETDPAKQRQALLDRQKSSGDVAGLGASDVLGEGEYTQNQMVLEARQRSGGTERDEGFREQHERRRKQGRARFTGLFGRTEGEVRTGLQAALYGDAAAGGYSLGDKDMAQLMELGLYKEGDEEAKKKFEAALGAVGGLSDEQRGQIRQTFQDFRTARDEKIGDKLDPNASSTPDAPISDARPHPGSPEAGKDLKDGKTGDPAATAAKKNEETKGPLKEGEAAAGSAKAAATEGTTPAPKPGEPTTPDVSPHPGSAEAGKSAAAEAESRSATPKDESGEKDRQTDALAAEISALSDVIKNLEKPFRDLIDALGGGADSSAEGTSSAGDSTRDEMRQQAQAARVSQQNNEAQRRGSSGGGGGGGGGSASIKGTLTLVGLQSAILSARGSPVFTPVGDGPSIVAGNPAAGAYLSSAAVSPAAGA